MMTPVTDLSNNTALLIIGAQDLNGLDSLISQVDGCWIWRPTAPVVEHVDPQGNVADNLQELSDDANSKLQRIVSPQCPEEKIAEIIRREVADRYRELCAGGKQTPQFGRKKKTASKPSAKRQTDWKALEEIASKGKVPAVPDVMSYRPHMEKVREMALRNDGAAINTFAKQFIDRNGGRVVLFKYIDLCLEAISAKVAGVSKDSVFKEPQE